MAAYTNEYPHSIYTTNQKRTVSQLNYDIHQQAIKVYDRLKTYGIHSVNRLKTAGFAYTGDGDKARCNTCGLEVSGWTQHMDPYKVHRELSPDCSFVCSIRSKNKWQSNIEENVAKRQKTELGANQCNQQNKLIELSLLQGIRQRTFSHWGQKVIPTKEQMIAAGFFHCNVGDRVICLYCNLICQQWKGETDDPVEVHKVLSPNCPYVLSILTEDTSSSVLIVNELPTNDNNSSNAARLLNNSNRIHFDQIVYTSACHVNYTSIPNRHASFEKWTNDSAPSVDDLVRAGFFYTGANNVITCFYCSGSLQNWGKNDNPLIEHIRWFPHCQYAKQLSGMELYNKVQEAKRIQREHAASKNSTNTTNNQHLQITDERLLSRLVAARLDLSISQRLLDQNFKLSVIKRCYEDQLQLKQDDFVSDGDLYIACLILQKQIDYINGNKDNIIIPSIKMKQIREGGEIVQNQLPSSSSSTLTVPVNNSIIKTEKASSVAEPTTVETTNEPVRMEETTPETKLAINNPCVLCWKEEKRLACIPCGHLVTCINCSQTLRTCPVCRRGIEAFVRIYL